MALFQASVLKSHLALLDEAVVDKAVVDKAYKKYQKYFWNTTIQENIKSAKEEQYQATFLNELFVNILGYTLFPNPNSNLTTEFKNEKNQRKADGAILKDGVAIGVIELKGTNTKDLESIRRQINKFIRFIQSKTAFQKSSKKLDNWHELDFGNFIKEINKVIKVTSKLRVLEELVPIGELTKKDEFEWMELFEENKKKAHELQTKITQTENEIDLMVYELYGLTEEKIRIVENT